MLSTASGPERRCVACRVRAERSKLLRVIRQIDGQVALWKHFKQMGRSAYVCKKVDCIEKTIKRQLLQRALNASLPLQVADDLHAVLQRSGNGCGD